jgi:hypothetical protein
MPWIREIKLYVNLVDLLTAPISPLNWTYPTNTTSDYDSKVTAESFEILEMYIPGSDLTGQCKRLFGGSTCALAITMYTNRSKSWDSADLDDLLLEYDNCQIMVSEEVAPVKVGSPTQGTVTSEQYKYYSVHVDDPQQVLFITMTVLNDGWA